MHDGSVDSKTILLKTSAGLAMKLPNANLAIVDDSKITEYLLNLSHPVGGPKARLFKKLLDIDLSNRQLLKSALLTAARDKDARLSRTTSYGDIFEIRFSMTASRGAYTVLSIRIVLVTTNLPRLVTAYVE